MKTLFWLPPWAPQSNPLFFRNTLRRHLLPQMELLLKAGHEITVVLNSFLAIELQSISDKITCITFNTGEVIDLLDGYSDPSEDLYKFGQESSISKHLENYFKSCMADDYDYILLWETPVPFLEALFPNATIIHQMPGVFSREPYPHTVTFDVDGLYRRGSFYKYANEIQTASVSLENTRLLGQFRHSSRALARELQIFNRKNFVKSFKQLALLPLQVTDHYAFKVDTGYQSQLEFLLTVLAKTPADTGLIVTQYISPLIYDQVLTPEIVQHLKDTYPNFIYRPFFDTVPSVSQYILPCVDKVITASSSLGVQGLLWGKDIEVYGETFITPFSGTRSSEQILSFLLKRNQPLAEAVTKDGAFLVNLMTELRNRRNETGLDRYVDFSEIDPDYNDRLQAGFRIEKAARSLGKNLPQSLVASPERIKQARFLQREHLKAISFDLFDTLICRPLEAPADVYGLLEADAIRMTGGKTVDFAHVRLNAEVQARQEVGEAEITLARIYEIISEHYGFDVSDVMEREIALEISLIRLRPSGKRAWDIAKATGKKIFIVSDMYLPESCIQHMLDKVGLTGAKLYLSSTLNKTKHHGGLFDLLLEQEELFPNELMHVGDNPRTDVAPAKERGIETYRVFRALHAMRQHDVYKKIFPPQPPIVDISRSAVVGAIINRFFDELPVDNTSLFSGSPYKLGFAGLGPIVLGYTHWLRKQAQEKGNTDLYFLSREGHILKKAFDLLEKVSPTGIKSHYLYASRRVIRVAGLQKASDVFQVARMPYHKNTTIAALLKGRFGLHEHQVDESILEKAGFANCQAVLDCSSQANLAFHKICEALIPTILANAQEERQNYLKYLQGMGFLDDCQSNAIVDVGWNANMQAGLGELRGAPLMGYYYATLHGAARHKHIGHKIYAYLGENIHTPHPAACISFRALTEALLCDADVSVERIDAEGNPIGTATPDTVFRNTFIREVHDGILSFVDDIATSHAERLDTITINPLFAERIYSSFAFEPCIADAKIMIGHHQEDNFAGVSKVFFIHEKNDVINIERSGWRPGAKALSVSKSKLPASQPDGSRLKKTVSVPPQKSSFLKGIVLSSEKRIIRLTSNDKKYTKYQRTRSEFFADSPSKILRTWGRISA